VAKDLLFRVRLGGELGIVNENELARLRELVLESLKLGRQLHYRSQPPVLASQLSESRRLSPVRGRGELALDLLEPGERGVQPIADAQAGFPYFWRNRSTRPAVSMSFCLPV
jgi:hypothetical protein